MPLARPHFRNFVAAMVCVFLAAPPTPAMPVELQKKTLATFDRYVRLREAQLAEDVKREKPFLWVDTLPEPRRAQAYAQLKTGEVVIERMAVLENGKKIEEDDGIIHHWMGTVFIPGATLKQTIELVQDYDHHQITYTPDVVASKALERNGNDFKIYMRFKKKKVITVILDTWQDVHYIPLNPARMHSRALTTRVQEVEDAGKPNEKRKPEGKDGGFMWRLNTYWLFEERDGGVYIQCEAISLSRSVPLLLGWLKGYITSVPKESLVFTLGTTRSALLKRMAAAAPATGGSR